MTIPKPAQDGISLSRFTRVGLGLGDWSFDKSFSSAALAVSLRSAMVLMGTTLLVYGAVPEWFAVFKQVDWKAFGVAIIRVAECSRWFFTVVQATRDLNRRWL
ncbi:hypothetical protein VTK26DRAFT_7598 [Humicola hyalothermophila]